jgi:prepilin-type processing-associated H-X9-DG protein
MPILFTCPHCGLQTNVGDEFAGRSGPCASCGKTITVPGPFGEPGGAKASRSGGGATVVVVLAVALGVVLVCGGVLVALLLPAVQAAREAARRSQCTNNLKQIALALHNYHDVNKCFPSAVLTDASGRPIRSWRVAILPFMEQQALYKQYDFNQPWDSPRNRALGGVSIPVYRCPSDGNPASTETNYVMVVGDHTIGGKPNEKVDFSKVTDGLSNTIAVVEVTGLGINWEEPKDITVDELLRLVATRGNMSNHPGGFNVALADCSVRFIPNTIDPKVLRDLLLRDDGHPIPPGTF